MAPAGAGVAAAIAVVALVRRLIEAPRQAGAEPVLIAPTAVGMLVAAGALLLVRPGRSRGERKLGCVLACAIALLGLLIVGHYLAAVYFGLVGPGPAQRPSPATGLAFVCVGVSLFATGRFSDSSRRSGDAGALAALVVALTALVGHAYGASLLYGRNPWGGTAAPTAIALGSLALGALFADPKHGIAALAASDSAGGQLLRRLVPVALLAPLILGWLAVEAQERGVFEAGFVTALLSVALSVLLVALLLRQAAVLHAASLEREQLIERERASRERATTILESITDAFFAVDRAWRFTYANREAERLLQRSREELIGRNVWHAFPEAIGARFQREYERALAEQRSVHFEEFFAPLDTWFEVQAFPSPGGLSVYFRDVSARKQAEQRLRESEGRYRLLVDMIPQHIWTATPAGSLTYFSRRWFEYSGTTLEQSKGMGWAELLHPADREPTLARWRRSLETGEPYTIEYRFRGADGTYHWFLGQGAPLRNDAGEIVEWIGTRTDISERKRLEEERERLLANEKEARAEAVLRREQLERVVESRAGLMRGFGHDVKNSLHAALASAQLLARGRGEGELSEKQRKNVDRIGRSIRTSVQLIDDLLELARAEAGQLELACEDTDVDRVARELTDDFRAQASAAGLALDVRTPEGLRAETDPARVRQILANLLSNAVKYAAPGSVTVGAERQRAGGPRPGDWVVASVADTGPGIPPDKHELIFEEYTRLDPKASQGAGIGLAISRRIARLLGGDLTVDSEVGRGSTFRLWIPAHCGGRAAAG